MNRLRTHIISRISTFFISAVFLNMGFFLSEVRMLKLDLNRDFAQNIVKLISGAGFEEERETGEEAPSAEGKVVDIFLAFDPAAPLISGIIIPKNKAVQDDRSLHPGCVEINTPPPKA